MAAEEFFQRWSRRNAELRQASESEAHVPAALPDQQKTGALPTLDDVAALTPESDFAPFVARGIDQAVQRSAMKKLFADPRFNVMDGLDTYIDDYNKFEPIAPEMLALLNHAKDLLDPLARLEQPPAEQPAAQAAASDDIAEGDAGAESGEMTEHPSGKPAAPAQDVPVQRAGPPAAQTTMHAQP